MNYVLQMMNSAIKMMNSAIKWWIFASRADGEAYHGADPEGAFLHKHDDFPIQNDDFMLTKCWFYNEKQKPLSKPKGAAEGSGSDKKTD